MCVVVCGVSVVCVWVGQCGVCSKESLRLESVRRLKFSPHLQGQCLYYLEIQDLYIYTKNITESKFSLLCSKESLRLESVRRLRFSPHLQGQCLYYLEIQDQFLRLVSYLSANELDSPDSRYIK